MKRGLFLAASIIAALAIGLGTAGTSEAASYAGHWRATVSAKCNNSPQNAKVCSYVIGPTGAIGKKGTTLTESGYDAIVASASGKFTDSAVLTLTETAPRAKHGCPSAVKLATVLFNGTCTLSERGRGHVANTRDGPVFHYDYEVLIYNHGAPLKDTSPSNSGVPTPAKVGSYSASWASRLAGSHGVPAGFTLHFVVTRS